MAVIDNELVLRAKNCDDEALKVIYDELKPFIKKVVLKFFLVGSDREDVIQEGMIGLFGAVMNYDPDKSVEFEPFAKRCIVLRIKTAVKNSLRKKHTPLNESVPIDDKDGNAIPILIFGPEEEYIDNENYEQLLTKLKENLTVFEYSVLCLLNMGMSYREIAEAMNREPKSIDNAIQRIKSKTKKILS